MAKKLTLEQQEEMREFVDMQGELVHAKDLVEFAEDDSTALHDWFEWDDSEAANQHRLQQARQAIRAYRIITISRPKSEPVLVSLSRDRNTGGGYRRADDVRQSIDMRNVVLQDAYREVHKLLKRLYDLEACGGAPITELRETLQGALDDLEAALAA